MMRAAAEWVTAHLYELRVISYLLGAFSLIFGARALGRFRSLTKQGGFYSALLFAVPAGLYAAGVWYVLDTALGSLFARIVGDALALSMSPIVIPAIFGVVSGLNSLVFAMKHSGDLTAEHPVNTELRQLDPFERILLFVNKYAGRSVVWLVSLYLALQYASSHVDDLPPQIKHVLPVDWLANFHLNLIDFLVWLGLLGLASAVVVYLLALSDALPEVLVLKVLYWIVGAPVLVLAVLVILVAGLVPSILYYVYLIAHLGWALLLYVAVIMLVPFTLAGFWLFTTRLRRRTLLSIFAVPGGIAAIIQAAVNGVTLLHH